MRHNDELDEVNRTMDADKLQAIQRPIKAKYVDDIESAKVVLRSSGRVQQDEVTCQVETDQGAIAAGLHPGCGGDGSKACSANMLLDALVGCAGVTLAAVTTAMRIPVRESRVEAFGDLDFRGTLGVDKSIPVGFKSIRLEIQLDCDASQEQIQKIGQLTERYCVVYQTLAHTLSIQTSCVQIQP